MKKILLFSGLLGLTVGAAVIISSLPKSCVATAIGQEPCRAAGCCGKPAKCAMAPSGKEQACNGPLVQELIAVLNETKSREVMVMTIAALAELGPEAKCAVPVILRNAERCDLLRGVMEASKDSDQSKLGTQVLEWLMLMLGKEKKSTAPCCAAGMCPAPPAAAQSRPSAAPIQMNCTCTPNE